MRYIITLLLYVSISIILLTSCGGDNKAIKEPSNENTVTPIEPVSVKPSVERVVPEQENIQPILPEETDEDSTAPIEVTDEIKPIDNGDSVQVIGEPDAINVLVNKQFSLPKDYKPEELVFPNIDYIFSDKLDKRKLRKEAADAIEILFKGAAEDQIVLLGVSAYRSNATQKALFERYVKRDGLNKARTYSAVPGHSEHETGLAIDVTGGDGKCAAEDCFGDTKEAVWLAEHAAEYGFIIRYPEGKQDITGYKYEPWHLRYVGTTVAQEIAEKGLTLEEYYNAIPVLQ
ncbi:MAG: M15 family metallopeptidase [Paenibacillaceae bacterium]